MRTDEQQLLLVLHRREETVAAQKKRRQKRNRVLRVSSAVLGSFLVLCTAVFAAFRLVNGGLFSAKDSMQENMTGQSIAEDTRFPETDEVLLSLTASDLRDGRYIGITPESDVSDSEDCKGEDYGILAGNYLSSLGATDGERCYAFDLSSDGECLLAEEDGMLSLTLGERGTAVLAEGLLPESGSAALTILRKDGVLLVRTVTAWTAEPEGRLTFSFPEENLSFGEDLFLCLSIGSGEDSDDTRYFYRFFRLETDEG